MSIRILIIFTVLILSSPTLFAKDEIKKQTENVLQKRSFSGLYRRADWVHWVDADSNCRDTRAEVLIRQSSKKVVFSRDGCSVVACYWFDPYTGTLWAEARDLDIDHIVPLAWANGHGGSSWPKYVKRSFANDLDNLIAVAKSINRSKGDRGPDEWLLPSTNIVASI